MLRITKVLQGAALLGVAVVAGLLGVGGTWALWNAAAPSGAGTVRAADFRVELNGSPMTVNGTSATVTLDAPDQRLTPTSPVHATVTITNATDAGGPFTINAAMGQPAVTKASVPALADALTVRTALAPASGNCADATFTTTPAQTTIAKGGSARICIRASLPKAASPTLRNATATVVVPVTATQREGA